MTISSKTVRSLTPLVAAALLVGCKLPGTAAKLGAVEGTIQAGLGSNAALTGTRTLRLRRADGAPLPNGTVTIAGRSFEIKDGVVQLPESIFQQAQRAGSLVLLVPGYAPLRVPTESLISGALPLSPLVILGEPMPLAPGGSQFEVGNLKLTVDAGLVAKDGTKVTLGSYTPDPTSLDAAFKGALTKVYQAAGQTVPTGASACNGPFPCPPVVQSVGLAVSADTSLSAGNMTIKLDLAAMLNGWDGQGNPPDSFTAAQKADAQAAARILETFSDMNAVAGVEWSNAVNNTYGLSLSGQVLTVPVTLSADALASGFARVSIPGSELLGTRLEVTVTTPLASAALGPNGLPIIGDPSSLNPSVISGEGSLPDDGIPADVSALIGNTPVADPTGQNAQRAGASIPLVGAPAGSTLTSGLVLALPEDTTGAVPPAMTSGVTPVPFDPGSVPGANGNPNQLISNNSSTVIANNSGAITGNTPVPGLVSSNGSNVVVSPSGQLLSNNGGAYTPMTGAQLLSNNAGSMVTNTGGGALTGYPYLPIQPALPKLQLLQVGVPAPPPVRVSSRGVVEYLWPGGLKIRAVDLQLNPLTDWAATDGEGDFRLPISGQTPAVFFLEGVTTTGGAHIFSLAFAPGSQTGLSQWTPVPA
jgi:hypothetical protein